ncbi:MAG: hypothetical protein QOD06_2840 [Candidatus Binatota bacterium]|jgi:hypothetical protein|nr:hypothetical protein [Candidatus Binatota bacterium]
MKRTFSSAVFVLLATLNLGSLAFGAMGSNAPAIIPDVELYRIRGYLDRAPEGAEIIDRVQITRRGEKPRELYVLKYQDYPEVSLTQHLSHANPSRPYHVEGDEQLVARLFSARPGAEVHGVFYRRHAAGNWLYVGALDAPADPALQQDEPPARRAEDAKRGS